MNSKVSEVVVEKPVVSAAIVAVVAAVVYAGLELALDGGVAPIETATFVAIFTVVYAGGNWVLRERVLADREGSGTEDDGAVAEATDAAE